MPTTTRNVPFGRLVEIGFEQVCAQLAPPESDGVKCQVRQGHRALPLLLGSGRTDQGGAEVAALEPGAVVQADEPEVLRLLSRPLVVLYARGEEWLAAGAGGDGGFACALEVSIRASSHDVRVEDYDAAVAHYGTGHLFNPRNQELVTRAFNTVMAGRCTLQGGWDIVTPPSNGFAAAGGGTWVHSFEIMLEGARE